MYIVSLLLYNAGMEIINQRKAGFFSVSLFVIVNSFQLAAPTKFSRVQICIFLHPPLNNEELYTKTVTVMMCA